MRARWGMAWLVAAFWLILVVCAPLPGWASGGYGWQNPAGGPLPIYQVGAQSSMEAQMLGEKSLQPPRPGVSLLQELTPSFHQDQDGTKLRLPYNLEMNISVRYTREASAPEPQRLSDSPLLMQYSMGYRVLSNLQVGLTGYLYRPADETLSFQRPLGNRLGFGPELKYNLGRWSFLVKSQVESGNRDRAEGLQNWFRVWYAF
jgi:hypothetical protein